jgi:hypothetical protein
MFLKNSTQLYKKNSTFQIFQISWKISLNKSSSRTPDACQTRHLSILFIPLSKPFFRVNRVKSSPLSRDRKAHQLSSLLDWMRRLTNPSTNISMRRSSHINSLYIWRKRWMTISVTLNEITPTLCALHKIYTTRPRVQRKNV